MGRTALKDVCTRRTPPGRTPSAWSWAITWFSLSSLTESPREPDPGELPPRVRGEEVAVRRADVPLRRRAGAAAQHHLPGHELAIVFAERARQRHEPPVGQIGAGRPLPHVA